MRYLIWISILLGCQQYSDHVTEVAIPSIVIEFGDSNLKKDSLSRIVYDGQPYSGILVTKDASGVIRKKQSYYQGVLYGDWIEYYGDGSVQQIRPYVAGKKHGQHKGWYTNGQLRFHYFFEHGLSVGNHKAWFADGSIYKDLNYKDGYEFGAQRMYRPDGKLRSNYVVRENGRAYGLVGLKRCSKIDTETENIDPYTGAIDE